MVGLKHVGVVIALWACNVLGTPPEYQRREKSFVNLGEKAAEIEYPFDPFDYGTDVGDCVCQKRFQLKPVGAREDQELLDDWLEECVASVKPRALSSGGESHNPDFRSMIQTDLVQRGLAFAECTCGRKIERMQRGQEITRDYEVVVHRHCREKIAEWRLLANMILPWSEEGSQPARERIRREIPVRVPKSPWKRTNQKNRGRKPPDTFSSSRQEAGTPLGSRQGIAFWQRFLEHVPGYFDSPPDEHQRVRSRPKMFGGGRPATGRGF